MPTRRVFLDTSYLLALELANDQNHQIAQTHWQQDKRYSLTDSISFIVMQQHSIQIAYTFDQHFIQAGFQKEPK